MVRLLVTADEQALPAAGAPATVAAVTQKIS